MDTDPKELSPPTILKRIRKVVEADFAASNSELRAEDLEYLNQLITAAITTSPLRGDGQTFRSYCHRCKSGFHYTLTAMYDNGIPRPYGDSDWEVVHECGYRSTIESSAYTKESAAKIGEETLVERGLLT